MGMFFRPELYLLLILMVVPWVIGFTYVRMDADRRGQPGWLWALLTLPLGWITILGYVVVRSLSTRNAP